MTDEISESGGGRSLARKLVIILAAFLVLLVIVYFVVSSSGFVKGVILPRVGKSMNAEISVSEASISPFSRATLTDLKVQPAGAEPLLTAKQVTVRYSLLSILRGNYVVNELTLTSPTIQIVKDASGKSNLDPVTQSQGQGTSAKSSEPLRVALHNITITDGVVRTVNRAKDGSVKTVELAQLNLNIDKAENGQPGRMKVGTGVRLDNRVPAGQKGTNDLMQGKLDGTFDFALDQKLLPQSLTGNATLAFTRGEGAYAELTGLSGILQAKMTPTDLGLMEVRFERGGQVLGRLSASGPLELAKSEGHVTLQVQSIDRQVLNLFGASHGWDFADSTLNATNVLDITRQGESIGAKGNIAGRKMSVRQQGQATPPMDLDVTYDVSVNLHDQTAVINRLNMAGRQQEKDLLRASLDKPMALTWAPASRTMVQSTFQLAVTQLNLQDWRSVLGTNAPSGMLDWRLSVVATNDAKLLSISNTVVIQDLAVQLGTNRLDQAQLSLSLEGKMENFKTLTIDPFNLDVQQRRQPLAKSNGSVRYDSTKGDLSLQANAELAIPALSRQFPNPQFTASNGVMRLSSAITQKGTKYTVTGNMSLGDFTGTYGTYAFQDFQTALDYNISLDRPNVQIHSASLSVRKGYSSGGNAVLRGDYDMDKQIARCTFQVVDLNQNAFGPFLAPSLGDKKLVSISLNGSGATSYDPNGDTSLKADLNLTNWVVSAPQQQFVSPSLGAAISIDGGIRQQVVDVRQFVLRLAPTTNASNQLELKGRVDMKATNATPSQLTLESKALDLTPYYDLFAGSKTTPTAPAQARGQAPATAPATKPPPKPVEPEPANLPIQQLTAELKIGSLFLRQLVLSNVQATAKINRGEVTLQPIRFGLNDGEVNASSVLNLGVPGYTYDMSLKADRLPLDPLVTTFTTNRPGLFKGDVFASTQLKGAGVTGPSLQRNLTGNLFLNLTNMNYEIVGKKTKRLLEPIATVLRVPELTLTPLNWIGAKAQIGKGQIDLQQFTVQSQAFYAESHGVIPMAEVLTNSPLNLPVNLSLSRALAQKASLLPANTPTNAAYTTLPSFVTLSGTLGDPKSDVNKVVIGGLLARSIGGMVPMGDKAGNILQGVGQMLTGQAAAGASTNAPSGTNASPAANIIQGIGSILDQTRKRSGRTNAPAAAPNKPAKSNPSAPTAK